MVKAQNMTGHGSHSSHAFDTHETLGVPGHSGERRPHTRHKEGSLF